MARGQQAMWVTALSLTLVAASVATAWACPTCTDALFEPNQLGQTVSTAKGYVLSIALLLGMPALLLAGVAALVVRTQRQKQG